MSEKDGEQVAARIEALLPRLIAFRHDLHAHPELSYEERRTASKVLEVLREIPGLEVHEGVGVTGIVATLGADLPGPCVALRADMDALPITEESGVPYASRTPGKMHACGHDGHTTMLLGAALVLAERRSELTGPVKFLFQPAEEGGAGGRRLVEEGALRDPKVEAIFGLHNMPYAELHVGHLAICPGQAMAGTAIIDITVEGRGGHAAAPHRAIDPIFAAAQVYQALQGIIARTVNPLDKAVLSITQFHAGTTDNVIPPRAHLNGTIRYLDPAVFEHICGEVRRRAEGAAAACGCQAAVNIRPSYPSLRNHPRTTAIFREVVREIGRERDLHEVPPMMGEVDPIGWTGERV